MLIVIRSRRIKCDEDKPRCKKCLKSGRPCEYPSPQPKRKKGGGSDASKRALVPKDSNSDLLLRNRPTILTAPSEPKFQTQQEYRCFQTFCEKTVFALAGLEEPDVWSRLVLQACERQESIKDTVVAIGALDQTLQAAQVDRQRPSFDLMSTKGHVTPHHQFALQKYGKAVRKMREDLSGGYQDLRTTVLSCLLFVAFELFHGNHTSALQQASLGLKMIMERMKDSRTITSNSKRRLDNLFNSIDEALIQKFVRLDLSSMAFVHENVVKAHQQDTSPEMFENLHDLPPVFVDLAEAQRYWELSMRPIMNFMTLATSWEYIALDSPTEKSTRQHIHIGDADWRLLKTIPPSALGEQVARASLKSGPPPPLPAMNPHLQRALDWGAAFEPRFIHSRTPEGRQDFARATLLQIRWKTTLISASSSPTAGEVQYDQLTHLFQDIIDLVKSITYDEPVSQPDRANFTFDIGRVGSLYVVATRCRDCQLRREAISLLLSKPRREGIWDNVFAARVATVIMIMEEAGLQGGFVPESCRIRIEGLSFDLLQSRGRLWYSSGKWRPPRQRIIESIEITW